MERFVSVRSAEETVASEGNPPLLGKPCLRLRHDWRVHQASVHQVGFSDAGEAGGLLYLVMEYVPGSSLGKLLAEQGQFAVGRAVRLAGRVLLALACSHNTGVVHRDVKRRTSC